MIRGLAASGLIAALVGVAAHAQGLAKPDCTVSDTRPNLLPPPPSRLPVETRRAIFVDLQQVVARAQREAAGNYPTAESGGLMAPTNVQKDAKLAKKRDAAALSLERTYLADVLKIRSITCTAAREIMREGKAAGWASKK
jgi:hypothetical protein